MRAAADPRLHLLRLGGLGRRDAVRHAGGGVAAAGVLHLAGVRARFLAGLRRARRLRDGGRQVPLRPAAALQQDCRRGADRVRAAHDGRVPAGLPRNEKRVHARRKPAGPFGALLVGVAFAFGWTPCIGPILGGILAIAGSRHSVTEGVMLLAVYSLGLGIPFLMTSLAINQFFGAAKRIRTLLPRHRARLGSAADRHRRADHDRRAHHHHALPLTLPPVVLVQPSCGL